MISAIGRMRGGQATARATHDPVPGTPPEGIIIQVAVAVDPVATIEVDLRDNPDNYPCGLNLSQACALSAAMVGIFNGVGHLVPPNAGSYRRVRILLREGCVVGIPRHPASCSVATTNLGDRVTCAVQRALAEIDEQSGMADGGAALPPAAGVISGVTRAGTAHLSAMRSFWRRRRPGQSGDRRLAHNGDDGQRRNAFYRQHRGRRDPSPDSHQRATHRL